MGHFDSQQVGHTTLLDESALALKPFYIGLF